jgi:DNA-binding GntR family transcriptional regulator
MNYKIEPTSSVPYPTQLKNHFKTAIINGELKDKAILPEYEFLSKTYGFGEDMVRKAYNELIREGYAKRIKKSGVFVHYTFVVDHMIEKMIPILEEIHNKGYEASLDDLLIEIVKSDEALNLKFGFKESQELIHSIRLFKADGIPILWMGAYYPYVYFNQLSEKALIGKSIYPLLYQASGCVPSSVEKNLCAIILNQKQSEILGLRKGSAGGMITGMTRDQDNKVIEVFCDIIPADRLRFIIK